MPQFLITTNPEWEPEYGDHFDALMDALEAADVASTLVEVMGADLLHIRDQARAVLREAASLGHKTEEMKKLAELLEVAHADA